MTTKIKLKKYFIGVDFKTAYDCNFYGDCDNKYDDTFYVWAKDSTQAKRLVLNYYKGLTYTKIYIDVNYLRIQTFIDRLLKKVPNKAICVHI